MEEKDRLYRVRHSLAHVMAQAVLEMFPEGKIAIGPPIEDGFYYDFELPRSLTPEDLAQIQARMAEILGGNYTFNYRVVSDDEARQLYSQQPYKLELIEDILKRGADEYGEAAGPEQKPVLSVYTHDGFTDLCRGPHVASTADINPKAFKLLSVAGAYWRGSEKNAMLQRIYGTAWEKPEDLKAYLARLEEAQKRDHRRLGKDLDLFSTNSETVGGGLILWHPNGALMRHLIEEFCKQEHLKAGYVMAYTPHIGRAKLWEISGHLDFYKENMYAPIEIEGQEYYLKPMNCPFHVNIYASRGRSYRDLPIRMAEWGTVYRFERSGVLHGLTRVRGFTQDDAHLFCRPDQMPAEIDRVLNFNLHILRSFGFTEFNAYLSTRPAKSVGPLEKWTDAEEALRVALVKAAIPFEVDAGGGAFYGPKIDLKVKDALGREWQISTIQFDFNLPERFDLHYTAQDGSQPRPYMIHRALLGSMERFFGVLIEFYGGAFPVWLQPLQVAIIPIADRHQDYAHELARRFRALEIRVEVLDSSDRMQAKIRQAQLQKIPYMLVVGDKEIAEHGAAVRLRSEENLGLRPIPEIESMILDAIRERRTV